MLRYALYFLILITAAVPALGSDDTLDVRELDGESLHFTVFWTGIPAAEAALCAEASGTDRMHFTTRAKSFPVVQLLYPLDSRIDSEVIIPGMTPTVFKKGGREGWGRQYGKRVVFDLVSGKSLYYRDDALKNTMDVPPEVQDPLSCLYLFRVTPLKDGDTLKIKIGDGSKMLDSTVKIIGREKVTVPAGTFDTIMVEPTMEGVGGIFAKSPGARLFLWLTDDKWKRPVKMYSKVRVGDFTAVLERLGPKGSCEPQTAGVSPVLVESQQ